jgi:hypothetical protein
MNRTVNDALPSETDVIVGDKSPNYIQRMLTRNAIILT